MPPLARTSCAVQQPCFPAMVLLPPSAKTTGSERQVSGCKVSKIFVLRCTSCAQPCPS